MGGGLGGIVTRNRGRESRFLRRN
ncbi:MAG: hypothetical protein JWO38_6784, partial [Gemmataceae bacterium]|nr:hypothetical protein [Gemmataceae bacterium]